MIGKRLKICNNFSWTKESSGIWDLTRSDRAPVTNPKVLPMTGSKKSIRIEPSRSALVIIDMQSKSFRT